MCGKFSQLSTWTDVAVFSQPIGATPARDADLVTATPMRFANILRLDADGARALVPMRWGFADRRAPNPSRPKHMHARAETIDERPTFADAFAHRRGILLVHDFNEGEELANGKTKQWTVTPRDGAPLAIAVIYEEWRKEEIGRDPETLLTFVMVTTPPNALIATITDRMPAILPPETWPLWLGETDAPLAEVKAALATFEDGGAWDMRPQGDRPKRGDDGGQGELF